MKYDAVTESGIVIDERVDIPEVCSARPPPVGRARSARGTEPRRAPGRPPRRPAAPAVAQELIPCDAHVEIDAKVFAGYFAGSKKQKTFDELSGTVGRAMDS